MNQIQVQSHVDGQETWISFLLLSFQQLLMRTCLPPADFKFNTCHLLLEIRKIHLLGLCVNKACIKFNPLLKGFSPPLKGFSPCTILCGHFEVNCDYIRVGRYFYFLTSLLLAMFCMIKFSPLSKWVLTVSDFPYVGAPMHYDKAQINIFQTQRAQNVWINSTFNICFTDSWTYNHYLLY